MSTNRIEDYFESIDLDIRKKGNNPRFIDQKCTPDVLSFIADCIIILDKDTFYAEDIWNLRYFQENAVIIFNKPSPNNPKANSEYDKFIMQQLELLSYSGLLIKSKDGRRNVYKINKETFEILEFVSLKDLYAYRFLYIYLNKALSDSGFIKHVNNFIKNPTDDTFDLLKTKFIRFLIGNSEIGSRGSDNSGEVEARRIFPKVLNVFSVWNNTFGTQKGRLSKTPIIYKDLMYDDINFRDLNKLKNMTRQEAAQYKNTSPQKYNKFLMKKALQWIKRHHPYSEVEDDLRGRTAEAHHIFPKKKFPEICAYIENLIALTAGQHKDRAHPRSNGDKVDTMYQCVCLLAKNKTIAKEHNSPEPTLYSKHNFIYVINTGFKSEIIPQNASFKEINEIICEYYKKVD